MINLLSSFLVGFLSTAFLFVLSIIIVLGVKYLLIIIKSFTVKDLPKTNENKKPSYKRKKRKAPTPQRSIEIDPSQVDRIYVKKSS